MFLEFYHLRQQPFGVTPDPAYLYLTRTHRDALTSLVGGIKEGRGFFALIAEPGMGKTTLLYQLLDELHESARTVFLFQTQCDSREFFQYLLSELGVDTKGMDLVTMHNKLNELLFAEMVAGRRFVLVVDEAQDLEDSVLETVRLLSNFETSYTKMLQIVLAGQPQLSGKLEQPKLAQLKQRLADISRLEPLSLAETANYIEHRLKIAGYSGAPLFAPSAIEVIAQLSGGTPRKINHLCYSALSAGHAQGREVITAEIVREVAPKLGIEPPASVLASQSAPLLETSSLSTSTPPGVSAQPAEAALRSSAVGATLSYAPAMRSRFPRWAFRALLVGGILLLAGIFLSAFVLRLSEPEQARTSRAFATSDSRSESSTPPQQASPVDKLRPESSAAETYSADPQESDVGQVITVAAMPEQTLRDITLLYIGRFDNDLFKQICALNPELKDPNHPEPGQLIRLPLPSGSFRKGKVFTPEQ